MSRGKNICSIDDRRQKTKGSGKMIVALSTPTRTPIGKKFIRQKHVVYLKNQTNSFNVQEKFLEI